MVRVKIVYEQSAQPNKIFRRLKGQHATATWLNYFTLQMGGVVDESRIVRLREIPGVLSVEVLSQED